MTPEGLTEMPGCWMVWSDEMKASDTAVFDDELEARRCAQEFDSLEFRVRWVPFGFSPLGVIEVERRARQAGAA